jgi:hypothetical protein
MRNITNLDQLQPCCKTDMVDLTKGKGAIRNYHCSTCGTVLYANVIFTKREWLDYVDDEENTVLTEGESIAPWNPSDEAFQRHMLEWYGNDPYFVDGE